VPAAADDRRAESEPELVRAIRDEIGAAPGARITFARFMERALTEPGLGYYATSDMRPTRSGDFLTAPELHPFFGRCVGRQLTEVWTRLGSPARFVVREWGAGRGTLARTVRDGLRSDASGLADALDWEPVDLPGRRAPRSEVVVGAVVANEYLDALPVHRVVRRGGRLLERYVAWRDGWFAEEDGEPSSPALAAHLDADGVALADGQLAEIGLTATRWVERAARELRVGVMLVIDYGRPAAELYGPRRMAGSLVTYRRNVAGDDAYRAVGRQDLTAHVDLTALGRAAIEAGLERLGSTTQARFLVGLGLGELLSDLGRDPATDAQAYLDARASAARLLDPRHLGGFRVLAFGRGLAADPELAGFRSDLAGR
jgi:SAM-dependent MidA family methyltransferase